MSLGGVRAVVAALLTLVLALPLAIVLTFLLLPFWSWLETTWGIEAVGHASLSEWCFVATWIALGVPLAWLGHRAFARRPVAR